MMLLLLKLSQYLIHISITSVYRIVYIITGRSGCACPESEVSSAIVTSSDKKACLTALSNILICPTGIFDFAKSSGEISDTASIESKPREMTAAVVASLKHFVILLTFTFSEIKKKRQKQPGIYPY